MRKTRYMKYFPYKPRKYQEEVVKFIVDNIMDSNICLHAATGFGKTPVILAALLSIARKYGLQIIWAVRTGNETDRPIEELKEIEEKTKAAYFGFSLRGKKDMCLLARERKLDDYESVAYLCQRMRKKCKYYDNLRRVRWPIPREPLLYSEILEMAKNFDICPYFLQYEFLNFADIVSLSYNYILTQIGWSIRNAFPFRNTILVVDEAHNLQFAIMNLYSDKISLRSTERAINELKSFETAKAERLLEKLIAFHDELQKLTDKIEKSKDKEIVFDPIEIFENADITDNDIDSIRRYGSLIRSKLLEEGKPPRSSLYHLANYIDASIETYGIDGVEFLAYKEKDSFYFERWDMRAKEIMRDIWPNFASCIFCSGTLTPINAFAETIGLENYKPKVVPSFYSLWRIKSIILTDVTTRGEKLPEHMIEKYNEVIRLFLENTMETNSAIFSASYRIQNDLLPTIKEVASKLDRPLFVEYEGMSGDEGRRILDGFKQSAYEYNPGVLAATMTGRFAEGADFPGPELENVLLIGIPFDKVTLRTKLYIEYYKRVYGKEKGGFYAYIVPALRRAAQTMGRVIRSESDNGLFVLGDKRYLDARFFALLPDYIRDTAEKAQLHDLGQKLQTFYGDIINHSKMVSKLKRAIKKKETVKIYYESQSSGLKWREIKPVELETNYLIAIDLNDKKKKRYRIDKIIELKVTRT